MEDPRRRNVTITLGPQVNQAYGQRTDMDGDLKLYPLLSRPTDDMLLRPTLPVSPSSPHYISLQQLKDFVASVGMAAPRLRSATCHQTRCKSATCGGIASVGSSTSTTLIPRRMVPG